MKKTIIVAIACLAVFAACDKNEGGKDKFSATITLNEEVPSALTIGQPVRIAGTVTSDKTITGCVLTSVKQDGKNYTAVGDDQEIEIVKQGVIDALFFPDTKDITAIKVSLKAGDKTCDIYYPATASGEWTGKFWQEKTAALYADAKVATHDNDPENYPEVGTGAGSDSKSFFSMPGVEINGEVKHILSLNELRPLDGRNASMIFLNVLQNTSNNAYIGGQRGYAFTTCIKAQIGGGTMGRQCDIYQVDGHGIVDANVDAEFQFLVVPGSWIGEKYNEPLYTYLDSLFIQIPNGITTTADKMRAHYCLGDIQRKLDNATLGVEVDPTALTLKKYARRWTDAGTNAASLAKATVEGFRAGDYMIMRTKRGDEASPVWLYGIAQFVQLPDDSAAFTTPEGAADKKLDQTLAADLFGKAVYMNIKCQSEL